MLLVIEILLEAKTKTWGILHLRQMLYWVEYRNNTHFLDGINTITYALKPAFYIFTQKNNKSISFQCSICQNWGCFNHTRKLSTTKTSQKWTPHTKRKHLHFQNCNLDASLTKIMPLNTWSFRSISKIQVFTLKHWKHKSRRQPWKDKKHKVQNVSTCYILPP